MAWYKNLHGILERVIFIGDQAFCPGQLNTGYCTVYYGYPDTNMAHDRHGFDSTEAVPSRVTRDRKAERKAERKARKCAGRQTQSHAEELLNYTDTTLDATRRLIHFWCKPLELCAHRDVFFTLLYWCFMVEKPEQVVSVKRENRQWRVVWRTQENFQRVEEVRRELSAGTTVEPPTSMKLFLRYLPMVNGMVCPRARWRPVWPPIPLVARNTMPSTFGPVTLVSECGKVCLVDATEALMQVPLLRTALLSPFRESVSRTICLPCDADTLTQFVRFLCTQDSVDITPQLLTLAIYVDAETLIECCVGELLIRGVSPQEVTRELRGIYVSEGVQALLTLFSNQKVLDVSRRIMAAAKVARKGCRQ